MESLTPFPRLMHRHSQAFLPSFIYFSPRVDAFHTPFREYAWPGSFNMLVVLAWRGRWMSGAARFQTGQFLSPADEGDVQVQQGITDRGLTD